MATQIIDPFEQKGSVNIIDPFEKPIEEQTVLDKAFGNLSNADIIAGKKKEINQLLLLKIHLQILHLLQLLSIN